MKSDQKCSIQIVNLSGSKPTHVKKLTVSLPAHFVLQELLHLFNGHLVTGKKGFPAAQIEAENPRTGEVKGGTRSKPKPTGRTGHSIPGPEKVRDQR